MSTAPPAPAPAEASDSPAPPARRPRLVVMDALRFLASIAVIWIHTVYYTPFEPSINAARFAVPFFIAAAVFLIVEGLRYNPERRFIPYGLARVRRIYFPFLFWTAIYILARQLKHHFLHTGSPFSFGVYLLWNGSAQHLWFLPFLLVISLLTFPTAKAILAHPAMTRAAAAAALGALCAAIVLCAYPHPIPQPENSFNQGTYFLNLSAGALPAAAAAFAVALLYPRLKPRLNSPRSFPLLAAMFLALILIPCFVGGNRATENLAGLGALFLGLTPAASPLLRRLASLGPYAYAIYLVHVLYEESLLAFMNRAHVTPGPVSHLSLFAATAVLSILTAILLTRSKYTRWTVAA